MYAKLIYIFFFSISFIKYLIPTKHIKNIYMKKLIYYQSLNDGSSIGKGCASVLKTYLSRGIRSSGAKRR